MEFQPAQSIFSRDALLRSGHLSRRLRPSRQTRQVEVERLGQTIGSEPQHDRSLLPPVVLILGAASSAIFTHLRTRQQRARRVRLAAAAQGSSWQLQATRRSVWLGTLCGACPAVHPVWANLLNPYEVPLKVRQIQVQRIVNQLDVLRGQIVAAAKTSNPSRAQQVISRAKENQLFRFRAALIKAGEDLVPYLTPEDAAKIKAFPDKYAVLRRDLDRLVADGRIEEDVIDGNIYEGGLVEQKLQQIADLGRDLLARIDIYVAKIDREQDREASQVLGLPFEEEGEEVDEISVAP
mmetsp:Transcript_64486/g.119981  ORF Transcript_64486/g.119981 Transcript_64486/m.119981 type:complete len:294 (+) Transcript_64486:43-924(+)